MCHCASNIDHDNALFRRETTTLLVDEDSVEAVHVGSVVRDLVGDGRIVPVEGVGGCALWVLDAPGVIRPSVAAVVHACAQSIKSKNGKKNLSGPGLQLRKVTKTQVSFWMEEL